MLMIVGIVAAAALLFYALPVEGRIGLCLAAGVLAERALT